MRALEVKERIRTPMYMCLKNDIAMVLESASGYMCIEKAIAEILSNEASGCVRLYVQ